ncbi:membrane protein insertase YidC [Candidatus Daviesbacteria bacterium]|nr:membrane protein insertase YidC [Candidatus Daviesbacteria bacterium]
MPVIGDLFNTLFFQPTVNLLVLIIRSLEQLSIPGAFGLSIIILTFLIRLVLWPLMGSQLKSAKKISDLKPKLDELKLKHKDDKTALYQAQMSLYKEHGVNPAGGCLPTLLQIPFFIAIYQVISSLFAGSQGITRVNEALYNAAWHLKVQPDPIFLGLNIADKPIDFGRIGMFVLIVPILTVVLQFIQSRMMMPKPVKPYPSDSPKEKKEKAQAEDMQTAMQSQMMVLMPIMIGYFALILPIGVSLFYLSLTIMGIIQQYFVSGWGGLAPWVEKLGLKK